MVRERVPVAPARLREAGQEALPIVTNPRQQSFQRLTGLNEHRLGGNHAVTPDASEFGTLPVNC
jgi:hypothetical protein